MTDKPLEVLLEMRPALDGHAGIPQEARLLFRGLCALEGVSVTGLLQSSGRALDKALPASLRDTRAMPAHKQLNRLSRLVISLEQGRFSPHLAAVRMAIRQIVGQKEELGRFDGTLFKDFIWRSLFARTLHSKDFSEVTAAPFRVARVPWTAMHRCALATRAVGCTLYPRIDTSEFDVMIAETPYPGKVSSNTRLVVRYHDAIPLLMPHTISDKAYHQASHYHALKCNVESGAHFACVSDATRQDLLSIFPGLESRSTTIHNMISDNYYDEESPGARVPEIVRTRLNAGIKHATALDGGGQGLEYLLIVSTIEPRKNHTTLLAAWEHLRAVSYPNLKLVVVGMLGWDSKPIIKKFRPWIERGDLFVLEDVPSPELRLLYKHARATVCPSFYEGFDFSGVEAMRCGGAVVASDIPVHREIYRDAAEFFSPYSTKQLVDALTAVIDTAAGVRRNELIATGADVSRDYLPEVILPKWQSFLGQIPGSLLAK